MADISRLAGPSLEYWEWQMHAACLRNEECHLLQRSGGTLHLP